MREESVKPTKLTGMTIEPRENDQELTIIIDGKEAKYLDDQTPIKVEDDTKYYENGQIITRDSAGKELFRREATEQEKAKYGEKSEEHTER